MVNNIKKGGVSKLKKLLVSYKYIFNEHTSFKEMINPVDNVFDLLFKKMLGEGEPEFTLFGDDNKLKTLYHKAALFYHYTFYCKLVEILECVYKGYNGNASAYVPPSATLDSLYIKIRSVFYILDRRPDCGSAKIVAFDLFPDLYGNHLEQLTHWEKISFNYEEDKETLRNRLIQTYPLADDVRLVFYDIDKELEEQETKRENTYLAVDDNKYKIGSALLDLKKMVIQFGNNKPVTINPDNQEIKLLRLLLQNIDVVVSYQQIAEKLDLNSYRGEATEEVKNAIKMVKKKLTDLLTEAKFKKEAIQSIRGNGYILNSNKLK